MASTDPNVNYKSLTENFLEATTKHAPLKRTLIRGDQAPFMNRDFQKAICTRSSLKIKDTSIENEEVYKKQKNLCV